MRAKPTCPRCGADGVPLVFGLARGSPVVAAKAGMVALGGCLVRGDGLDPNWQCVGWRHHRWRDDDRAAWEAAYEAAIESLDIGDTAG